MATRYKLRYGSDWLFWSAYHKGLTCQRKLILDKLNFSATIQIFSYLCRGRYRAHFEFSCFSLFRGEDSICVSRSKWIGLFLCKQEQSVVSKKSPKSSSFWRLRRPETVKVIKIKTDNFCGPTSLDDIYRARAHLVKLPRAWNFLRDVNKNADSACCCLPYKMAAVL